MLGEAMLYVALYASKKTFEEDVATMQRLDAE